jgi:hypothetical protein
MADGLLNRPSMFARFIAAWAPTPILKPQIDPCLDELTALERIAEVCRYTCLRLEYAVSSGGTLRAWVRVNLMVLLTGIVPALLLVPLLTLLASEFTSLTGYLLQASRNLLDAVVTLIEAAAALAGLFLLLRMVLGGGAGGGRRRR